MASSLNVAYRAARASKLWDLGNILEEERSHLRYHLNSAGTAVYEPVTNLAQDFHEVLRVVGRAYGYIRGDSKVAHEMTTKHFDELPPKIRHLFSLVANYVDLTSDPRTGFYLPPGTKVDEWFLDWTRGLFPGSPYRFGGKAYDLCSVDDLPAAPALIHLPINHPKALRWSAETFPTYFNPLKDPTMNPPFNVPSPYYSNSVEARDYADTLGILAAELLDEADKVREEATRLGEAEAEQVRQAQQRNAVQEAATTTKNEEGFLLEIHQFLGSGYPYPGVFPTTPHRARLEKLALQHGVELIPVGDGSRYTFRNQGVN